MFLLSFSTKKSRKEHTTCFNKTHYSDLFFKFSKQIFWKIFEVNISDFHLLIYFTATLFLFMHILQCFMY